MKKLAMLFMVCMMTVTSLCACGSSQEAEEESKRDISQEERDAGVSEDIIEADEAARRAFGYD